MGRNKDYPKYTFRDKVMMGEYKAMRDLFKELYIHMTKREFSIVSKEFLDIGKEVYEEYSGEKLEA